MSNEQEMRGWLHMVFETNGSALNDECAGVFLVGIILVGTAISALLQKKKFQIHVMLEIMLTKLLLTISV